MHLLTQVAQYSVSLTGARSSLLFHSNVQPVEGDALSVPCACPQHKVLKGVTRRDRMAQFTARDARACITFGEGIPPSPEQLQSHLPWGRREAPIEPPALTTEERQAWWFTRIAEHYAVRRGYEPAQQPPLDTWLIGQPRGPPALLADWFEGMPSAYRLFVHRYPLAGTCREHLAVPEGCWEYAYQRAGITRRRTPGPRLKTPVLAFLDQVLYSYRTGELDVASVFEASGHSFVRSPA